MILRKVDKTPIPLMAMAIDIYHCRYIINEGSSLIMFYIYNYNRIICCHHYYDLNRERNSFKLRLTFTEQTIFYFITQNWLLILGSLHFQTILEGQITLVTLRVQRAVLLHTLAQCVEAYAMGQLHIFEAMDFSNL